MKILMILLTVVLASCTKDSIYEEEREEGLKDVVIGFVFGRNVSYCGDRDLWEGNEALIQIRDPDYKSVCRKQ